MVVFDSPTVTSYWCSIATRRAIAPILSQCDDCATWCV